MISPPDRQQAVALIDEARASGARLKRACQELGIEVRTYQRWTQDGGIKIAARPALSAPCRPTS